MQLPLFVAHLSAPAAAYWLGRRLVALYAFTGVLTLLVPVG